MGGLMHDVVDLPALSMHSAVSPGNMTRVNRQEEGRESH
jgi:hypothetical protein